MKAAVLAGGFGTRIQPLTSEIPKPMLPVMNQPMLSHVLDGLAPLAPTDLAFFLFYIPERIREWFDARPRAGTRFHYFLPDADYGTAGTLHFARSLLDGTFIVISGDLVTDIDLSRLLDSHRRSGAVATIALTKVANPLQYGVVVTGDDGRVKRFLEKPGWGEVVSDTINTGIYILEPDALACIPSGRPFDFSRDLFPLLLRRGMPVHGAVMKGYWRDVGNADAYRQVHADLFHRRARVRLPGRKIVVGDGDAWLEEGAEVSPRARVAGSIVVGKGVRLPRGFYAHSVFGEGTDLGEGCFIEGSVLWRDVKAGAGCRVRNSVLCDGVRLGDEVYIPDGAILASHSIVQDRATLERDVTVGPGRVVEAGSVLSANLVSGERWTSSLFQGNRVAGQTSSAMSAGFCARLGEAFGTAIPPGGQVLVSRDYHRASRMLRRSFLGGVLGAGVNVSDLSLVPVPVTLFNLTLMGGVGGVHFRQKPEDPDATELLFFDTHGFPLPEEKTKAIERLFSREDFRRTRHDHAGVLTDFPLAIEHYREGFLAALDREEIRRRRFSIVLDLAHGLTSEVLPGLLTDLGVETVVLNAHRDETRLSASPAEVRRSLARVGKIVRSLGADMGFYLFPGGLRVLLVDGEGVPRPDHQSLLFVLSLLAAAGGGKARVHLPGQAPRLAVARVKGITAAMGRQVCLEGAPTQEFDAVFWRLGRYAFPRFMPHTDAMFAVAAILDLLARTHSEVREGFEAIPKSSFLTVPVECPHDRLGQAMRGFREAAAAEGGDLSFEDGIVSSFPWGWVSLTPDEIRPHLFVHLESRDPRKAKAEAGRWSRRVARWVRDGVPSRAVGGRAGKAGKPGEAARPALRVVKG